MKRLRLFPPMSTYLVIAVVLAMTALFWLVSRDEGNVDFVPHPISKVTQSGQGQLAIWAGPEPEIKRSLLLSPLFSETRRLPDPFAPPPPLLIEEPPTEETSFEAEVSELPLPPAPPPEQSGPPPPPPEPDLNLFGVFLEGERRMALLQSNISGGHQEWVALGEMVGGWRLAAVAADHVLVTLISDPSVEAAVQLYPPEMAAGKGNGSADQPDISAPPAEVAQ